MQNRKSLWAMAFAVFLCVLVWTVQLPVYAADTVHVITITGEIDGGQAALVQRGIKEAEEQQDQAVLIRINTQGGRVDSALCIRDLLQHSQVPTIAFITSRAWSAGALIALSCRHIVMAPGSSIGAAEPIPATEKNIAALKSEFSTTAEGNGYNPRVAEAMVDKKTGFPGYAEAGEIVALTDSQAKALNISSGTADTVEEALRLYSIGSDSLVYVDRNWHDEGVSILQNPYVRIALVGLIIAAVLVEIKAAGIGIGLVTALLLGGLMLVGGDGSLTDDLKIIGAFLAGLLLIAMEIFVVPGAGIFGVAGVILFFGSIFWMLGADIQALYILAGGLIVAIVLLYIIGKRFPKSHLFDRIMLKNRSTEEKGYTSQEDKSEYLFQKGVAITPLRPAGTIRIGQKRVDAVSSGSYIDRDEAVRVIQVEGTRVVVEPVPNQS